VNRRTSLVIRRGRPTRLVAGLATFFAVLAALPAAAAEMTALEQALRAADYRLYQPPRSNWGPGFVFAGDVADGRISRVEEICPNLYADLSAPQAAAVVLPDYKASDSFSLGLAVDFLKKQLGAADLAAGWEGTTEVTWQNIRELSYSRMDQWLESGEPRPIARRCRLAIEDLRAKNRFKGRLFVIVRALAPAALVYDFSRTVKGGANAATQLSELVHGKLEGRAEIRNATQLVVKEPMFVGYAAPMRIEDWLPTGLVSGEVVEVRGARSDLIVE
jgi:hypothetical protein